MKKRISIILFIFTLVASAKAQADTLSAIDSDTLTSERVVAKSNFISRLGLDESCKGDESTQFKATRFIVPAALVGYGFALYYIPALKDLDRDIRKEVQENIRIRTKVDDVLTLVPATTVFALDWCGVSAKHTFKDRVIVAGTSYAMGLGATLLAKKITDRWRPDLSEENSFPSGHTMSAFVGAHILMKEYSRKSVWIGVSGYVVASGIGFLRIANNRHWFSDVIVGAGFGILSVELSYLMLPYLSQTFTLGKKKMETLTVGPMLGEEGAGLGVRYSF